MKKGGKHAPAILDPASVPAVLATITISPIFPAILSFIAPIFLTLLLIVALLILPLLLVMTAFFFPFLFVVPPLIPNLFPANMIRAELAAAVMIPILPIHTILVVTIFANSFNAVFADARGELAIRYFYPGAVVMA
jgi:hypothetical protein